MSSVTELKRPFAVCGFYLLCFSLYFERLSLQLCYFLCFRLQMLDHFAECVKQAKGVRQQAVQLNIFTAVLSALKVGLVNL